MIEIVFDYSRIELTPRQTNQLRFKTLYEFNMQNSIAAKESLLRYINSRLDISEIKDKQIIILKPFKTNDKVHFDISKVNDERLKIILKRFLNK